MGFFKEKKEWNATDLLDHAKEMQAIYEEQPCAGYPKVKDLLIEKLDTYRKDIRLLRFGMVTMAFILLIHLLLLDWTDATGLALILGLMIWLYHRTQVTTHMTQSYLWMVECEQIYFQTMRQLIDKSPQFEEANYKSVQDMRKRLGEVASDYLGAR